MANIFDLLGRIFISALFIISAYDKILSIDGTTSWMEGFGIPGSSSTGGGVANCPFG